MTYKKNKSAVLIINSPLFRGYQKTDEEDSLPPIGLGYIATFLKLQNIQVELIDSIIQNISLPKLKSIIRRRQPEFLAINIFSTNLKLVKEIVESINFKVHIIIGGLATRTLYPQILQWKTINQIDVVTGDGELITPDIILNQVKEKSKVEIPNRRVFDINRKSIYFIKDISTILLNRDFFNNEPNLNYFDNLEASIVTSRGCIYNCSFCAAARSLNKEYPARERSTDSIVRELNYIKTQNPETVSIRVLDDLFLKSKDSITNAIDIFSKFDFQWRSMAHIKTFKGVGEDLLMKLKESGCYELFIGIESGSPIILKSMNKTHDIRLIKENVEKLFKAKINVKCYFIYGFPDETLEDMEMTYNLALEIKKLSLMHGSKFRTSVFQFRTYHGTLLYENLKRRYPGLDIDTINPDGKLTHLIGRKQFNFHSINHSKVSLKLIRDYICKTDMI